MKKKTFLSALILAAIAILSLGVAGVVLAVDSSTKVDELAVSISVSPGQQHLSLDPGETKAAEITIINSGNFKYEARVYASTYAVAPDYTGNVFDSEATTRSQIYRWISFGNGEPSKIIALEPGARQTVEFTISVPENVPAGGQYAGIMAEIIPPADETGVIAVRRIASLLYANINGETINKGEITNRVWQSYYSSQDVKTSLTITNLGNTDFAVENRLTITSLFGKTIDEVVEPPKLILPETSRTFELNWRSGRRVGIYRLTQQSQFLDQTISETKLIFVIPIWFTVLVIAAIIAAVFIIIVCIKKKRRKEKHNAH
jgi:hypothetical protein